MTDDLSASERIFAELVAQRVVISRLVGITAAISGNFDQTLKSEHQNALRDLANHNIQDSDPKRAANIRMHAEAVVDQIYTTIKRKDPPS